MDAEMQTRRDPITVVSTFTTDLLPAPDGTVIPLPGGPAHYIGEALREIGWPHEIVTGERAEVRVVHDEGREAYVIPDLPPIPLPGRVAGRAMILSPINREIAPVAPEAWPTLLAIDLQGFVRVPGKPSHTLDADVDILDLLRAVHVVKGGPEELAALDSRSREALRDRLVLETLGDAGLVLSSPHGRMTVRSPQVSASHTIGAGDTLLAAFVVELLRGRHPLEGAERAVAFTAQVLERRVIGAP